MVKPKAEVYTTAPGGGGWIEDQTRVITLKITLPYLDSDLHEIKYPPREDMMKWLQDAGEDFISEFAQPAHERG